MGVQAEESKVVEETVVEGNDRSQFVGLKVSVPYFEGVLKKVWKSSDNRYEFVKIEKEDDPSTYVVCNLKVVVDRETKKYLIE